MKKISVWARDHKRASRFIIVASFILLNALGILTGILLNSLGITIPVLALLFFGFAYCLAFITYPSRLLKRKKQDVSFYRWQKTRDLILAGSTFLMIVYLGNHRNILFQYSFPFNKAIASSPVFPKDSTVQNYKPLTAFAASLRDQNGKPLKWKERKKLLTQQVKAIKKTTAMSNGEKTVLIILSVLLALLLLYGVAALACSLSCSGSDALAIIVGLGGGALVIWLLIVMIRSIVRKQKKKEKDRPVTN